MSKFASLIKIQLMQLSSRSNFQTLRKNKAKKSFGLSAVILPVLLMVYISGFYTWVMCETIPPTLSYLILISMSLLTVMILFFFAVYMAQGHLFGFKDFDMLMSWPLPRWQVMLSKLVSFLLMEYFYAFLLIIPMIFIYGHFYPQPLTFYVLGLIGFLFLPLLPVVLSSLLALLIHLIGGKSRYKSLITNILSLVMFVLIIVGTFQIQTLFTGITNFDQILDIVRIGLPSAYYFGSMLVSLSFTDLLFLIGVSVIPLVLFLFFFQNSFVKLNGNLETGYKVKNFKLKRMKRDSVTATLFHKEMKKYFSNNMYMMNTAVGQLMLLIGVVGLLWKQNDFLAILANSDLKLVISGSMFPLLLGMMVVLIMMTCTTGCSISLEGKKLWILKSAPVNSTQIYLSKILVNLLVALPLPLIFSVICTIALGFSLFQFLILVVVILVSALFISLFGMIANLWFPRLDYDREILVIKQSMSSMISIFGGLIIGAGSIALFFVANRFMDMNTYIVLMVCIGALIDVMMILYLKVNGEKLFIRLH